MLGIDCIDGDNVVMMMPTMKSVARFSSRCAVLSGMCWGFQCKAGQGGGGTLNSLALQCNALQYSAMQCNAVQYNVLQCNTIQYSAMLCSALQSQMHAALHCPEKCSTVLQPEMKSSTMMRSSTDCTVN